MSGDDRAPPRVLFYVQHLLGIGHVMRVTRIAAALHAQGAGVFIANGGEAVPGLDFGAAHVCALAPVKIIPPDFSTLLNSDGTPFSDAQKRARAQALVRFYDDVRPDGVVLEAFPFGRRQMRFELMPLLEHMHRAPRRPLVVASVRDILQANKKKERIEETLTTLKAYFDLIIVHGDPKLIALDGSFPAISGVSCPVCYSGLVGPPARIYAQGQGQKAERPLGENFDVIVSAGGGAVGTALLDTAFEACVGLIGGHGGESTWRWLFLTGPNSAPGKIEALARRIPQGSGSRITIAPFRADLPDLLTAAKLSISQAGYNTVADVLAAGCRAIFVPYSAHGEQEQRLRAQILARAKRAVMIEEDGLNREAMCAAITQAMALERPPHAFAQNGAAETARLLLHHLTLHQLALP